MKKLAGIIFLSMLLATAARADAMPLPGLRITFSGFEGEEFYAALLVSTPPDRMSAGYAAGSPEEFFETYTDRQGCYVRPGFVGSGQPIELYSDAPESFRLLLWFPNREGQKVWTLPECAAGRASNRFSVTCEKSSDPAEDGVKIKIARETGLSPDLWIRLGLTLAIELALAPLFRLRSRRELLTVAGVNLLTVAAGALLLNLEGMGGWYYLALAAAGIAAEAAVLALTLRRDGKKPERAIAYALCANLLSLAAGTPAAAAIAIYLL